MFVYFLRVEICHHDCLTEVAATGRGNPTSVYFKVTEKGSCWMFVKVESMSLSLATQKDRQTAPPWSGLVCESRSLRLSHGVSGRGGPMPPKLPGQQMWWQSCLWLLLPGPPVPPQIRPHQWTRKRNSSCAGVATVSKNGLKYLAAEERIQPCGWEAGDCKVMLTCNLSFSLSAGPFRRPFYPRHT